MGKITPISFFLSFQFSLLSRLSFILHNPTWTRHTSAHAIRLISPWAGVQRIDYESHPLIRRGLNSASALKEVTFAWLSPSRTPWPLCGATGESVCISLYLHAIMWDGIGRNGRDQNHDISDRNIWGSAVASWISYAAHRRLVKVLQS